MGNKATGMSEEERKTRLEKIFNDVAQGYDGQALRFFPESARHLAVLLNLKGDEYVLDVATGTGSTALAVAQRLPNGRVFGVDIARGMLVQAKARAVAENLSNVDFQEMDMQMLDLPGNHYDIATCAFGIFFVEDMEQQLMRVSEKVRSGGLIAITGFHDDAFLPMIDLFFTRLQQYGVDRPSSSWKRIGTEGKASALFGAAGLEHVRVERKNVGYHLRNANEWWDVIWYSGYRGLVSQLSAGDMEKFKLEHLREVQAMATNDGIWLDVEVLFTIGVKP